jgi:hypothetical protein
MYRIVCIKEVQQIWPKIEDGIRSNPHRYPSLSVGLILEESHFSAMSLQEKWCDCYTINDGNGHFSDTVFTESVTIR